jgi:hypothetical protein
MVLLALVSPLFFQVVVDNVLVHRTCQTLDALVLGLVAVTIFECSLRALRAYLFWHTGNRVDVDLRARLYRDLHATHKGSQCSQRSEVATVDRRQSKRRPVATNLLFAGIVGMGMLMAANSSNSQERVVSWIGWNNHVTHVPLSYEMFERMKPVELAKLDMWPVMRVGVVSLVDDEQVHCGDVVNKATDLIIDELNRNLPIHFAKGLVSGSARLIFDFRNNQPTSLPLEATLDRSKHKMVRNDNLGSFMTRVSLARIDSHEVVLGYLLDTTICAEIRKKETDTLGVLGQLRFHTVDLLLPSGFRRFPITESSLVTKYPSEFHLSAIKLIYELGISPGMPGEDALRRLKVGLGK